MTQAKTKQSAWQQWEAMAPPVPCFQAPRAPKTWQKQRAKIRHSLWHLLGNLPPRPKTPAVRTLSRVDRGDFVAEKLEFDNGAGARVPGYLLLPKRAAGPSSAILYCHWHGDEYDIGKEEIFQARHTPEAPGPALARRGYVVLAIDAYCFGERNGQGPGGPAERGSAGEMTASKFNLWHDRTLWGMILRDDLIALDYLLSRPEVDPERVGVTGISMGATRTWWLMALDERLKAGVAVACLTRYQDLIAQGGLKYHGIYYFVPGILEHFDTEAVVALIAPRPALFLTGDQDAGSPIAGVRKIGRLVRPVYRLYGQGANFQSIVYPGVGHQYVPDMWQRMLGWFDNNLLKNR